MDKPNALEQLTEGLTDLAYQHNLDNKARLSIVVDGKVVLTYTVKSLLERSRQQYQARLGKATD